MRKRCDFVSNSSSCSFIIPNHDIDEVRKISSNTEFIKVSDLKMAQIVLRDSIKSALKIYQDSIKGFDKEDLNNLCDIFHFYQDQALIELDESIQQLEKCCGDNYITTFIDKNYAYKMGMTYSTWAND